MCSESWQTRKGWKRAPFFTFETRQRFTTVLFSSSLFIYLFIWHSSVPYLLLFKKAFSWLQHCWQLLASAWPHSWCAGFWAGSSIPRVRPQWGHWDGSPPCVQALIPICYLPWWSHFLTATPTSASWPIRSIWCRKWSRSGQWVSRSFDCCDMDS